MNNTLLFICAFSFVIHMTESLAYTLRLAGLRTRQIAISMSFVTSTLLISRLSNMFQSPLIGAFVDSAVRKNDPLAIQHLEWQFRIIIFACFLGAFAGAALTPTFVIFFNNSQ